jgi:protein TonB
VVVHKIVSEFKNNQLQAPHKIPKKIAIIKESAPPPPSTGVVGGVGDGSGGAGGVLGGVLGGIPAAAPPPPPPPKTPSIIHVGGQVQSANCVRCPPPQYPPLARQARIQGVVRLHAIIAKDGTIQDLQVISGHPMLVGSAMQAVRQWRYAPTLLNGTPVEVDTEITVNFTLAG